MIAAKTRQPNCTHFYRLAAIIHRNSGLSLTGEALFISTKNPITKATSQAVGCLVPKGFGSHIMANGPFFMPRGAV